MATIINADTSAGLKLTSDTSGLIEFQSGGVTKAGVNATGLTGDASQLTAIPSPASLSTSSGSAPSYSARAWVNFNGTGTVAIRASGNVSSITDNGTGDYTINFTTAMADANYAVSCSNRPVNASGALTLLNGGYVGAFSQTTSAFRTQNQNYAGTKGDTDYAYVSVFR